jgi:altronate dehydratase small subunit
LSGRAIVLDREDNVATATTDLMKGDTIQVSVDILLGQNIPYGHKIALKDIKKGGFILKYGEVIGKATANISKGKLVHIHNVEGLRGRGDQK